MTDRPLPTAIDMIRQAGFIIFCSIIAACIDDVVEELKIRFLRAVWSRRNCQIFPALHSGHFAGDEDQRMFGRTNSRPTMPAGLNRRSSRRALRLDPGCDFGELRFSASVLQRWHDHAAPSVLGQSLARRYKPRRSRSLGALGRAAALARAG